MPASILPPAPYSIGTPWYVLGRYDSASGNFTNTGPVKEGSNKTRWGIFFEHVNSPTVTPHGVTAGGLTGG